jgi:hypothetical protein
MYYRLDNNEFERINRVSKITLTDYELKGNFIPVESMMAAIEDLLIEIDNLEEERKNREQDIEDNYRLYTREELYGVSDKDFY